MAIRITPPRTDSLPEGPTASSTRAYRPRPRALVPAASRGRHAPLTAAERDLSADAIDTFVRVIGGRQKLLDTLAIADTGTGADKVASSLLEPRHKGWSLRRTCAAAGITVADLFAAYKRALFVKAHLEAAHHVTSQLAPIVQDVMQRALPHKGVCPRCGGHNPDPAFPCMQCKGTGEIMIEPDLPRQKLALELGHLIERKAGIMVQQNAIAAGAVALTNHQPGSLEQLQQVVGELLFAPGRLRAAAPRPAPTQGTIDVTPRYTPADDDPNDPLIGVPQAEG